MSTGFDPALWRFAAFYGLLFAAFGVASPFLPLLMQQKGLGYEQLGLVLAGGTAIRLLAGPLGGRLADWTGRPRAVLAGFTALSAVAALGYAPAQGLVLLLAVSVLHAAVLAPLTPVADALAVGSAEGNPRFRYGRVRGAGSAAFILGVLLSGQVVTRTGTGSVVWMNAGFLALAACVAPLLPNRVAHAADGLAHLPARASVADLLRIRSFVALVVIAALMFGSHAMHDALAVIRWTRVGGMSAWDASMLWTLAVAAEIVVFLYAGPAILGRFGPEWALGLAALAGIVRWGVAAGTVWLPLAALVQPLHGLTFALVHLASMQVIARDVPSRLAATAQAVYATLAAGAAGAAVTLAAGPLYEVYGGGAFWAMAGLCVVTLPVIVQMHADTRERAWMH